MKSFLMNSLVAATIALVAAVSIPVDGMAEGATSGLSTPLSKTCKSGLLIWIPLGEEKECGQLLTPQVKIFGADGQLRYIGTAFDSFKWADSAMPVSTIPPHVKIRTATEEARFIGVTAPPGGHAVVDFYVLPVCPPCDDLLDKFKKKVLPGLGARAEIRVVTVKSN